MNYELFFVPLRPKKGREPPSDSPSKGRKINSKSLNRKLKITASPNPSKGGENKLLNCKSIVHCTLLNCKLNKS